MDKFTNLMYDFFAFALPGAGIIASLSLLSEFNAWLYSQIPETINWDSWQDFFILLFIGYAIGYIISPVARRLLLQGLAVYIFTKLFPLSFYPEERDSKVKSDKNRHTENSDPENEAKKHNQEFKKQKLDFDIGKKIRENVSWNRGLTKQLVHIRKLHPENAQYIEFWDMHKTMSHNLAFAVLVFFSIQIINLCKCSSDIFLKPFSIILLIATLVSFFILLFLSLKYSIWWDKNIRETYSINKES